MKTFNVHDAKTRLPQLITAAEQDELVIIARQGVPVARVVPFTATFQPEPGTWLTLPGWASYKYDPIVLAPIETDKQLAAEGWPGPRSPGL